MESEGGMFERVGEGGGTFDNVREGGRGGRGAV